MSNRNGGDWDIGLTLPAGTIDPSNPAELGLMLDVPEGYKTGDDLTLDSALSPAASDSPVTQAPVAGVRESWVRGIGLDYNIAPAVDTRVDEYAFPAGASVPITIPTGVGNTNDNPLVAFCEFNSAALGVTSALLIAQEGSASTYGGRILRSSNGTGTGGGAFAAVTMTDIGNPYLAAGEYMRDIIVADNGVGTQVLFASSSNASGLNGRLHKSVDGGATWTSTAASYSTGTNDGRNKMAVQYAQGEDGAGGNRIVTISGPNTVAMTIPDSDPMLAASWIEDIKIATPGKLVRIVSARRTWWLTDSYGKTYYLDELGHSGSLESYGTTQQAGSGSVALYRDGWVYVNQGRAFRRTRVGEGNVVTESPGNCSPGWNTPARSTYLQGYPTAVCEDQGGISLALHNPTTGASAIFWGVPREVVQVDAPSPLIWHGPLQFWSVNHKVTAMMTASPASTGDMRLWVAAQSLVGGAPALMYFYTPSSGSSLDDLVSAGPMKFTTGNGLLMAPFTNQSSYLELLPDTGEDKAALKVLYQVDAGSEGPLSSTTKLTVKARALTGPNSPSYTSLGDITASPSQAITLPTVTSGNKLQFRIDFTSPDATATTPVIAILDSFRTLWWQESPVFRTVELPIVYGDKAGPDRLTDSEWDPDDITTWLLAATGSLAVTYRDRIGKRWTFKLRQFFNRRESLHDWGSYGKTVHATLRGDIVAQL